MSVTLKTILITAMVLLLSLMSCDEVTEPEFVPQLTINGELRAGYPIDSIYVNWSSKITEPYDTDEQRVSNADVRINGLQLLEYPDHKGIYYYPDTSLIIQSGESYALEVRVGDEQAYSETTVPSPFFITPSNVANGDTVQYIPGVSFFSNSFFDIIWPGYRDSPIFRILSIADVAADSNFIVDDRIEAEVFKGDPEDRENPGIWWVKGAWASCTPIQAVQPTHMTLRTILKDRPADSRPQRRSTCRRWTQQAPSRPTTPTSPAATTVCTRPPST